MALEGGRKVHRGGKRMKKGIEGEDDREGEWKESRKWRRGEKGSRVRRYE